MLSAAHAMHTRGLLLLLLTTLVWSTSFPVLKYAIYDLSPATLLAVRFALAAIVFSPWLRHLNRRLLWDGFGLGLLYFAETASGLVGLQSISASRSAFLVSLNVILVPLIGALSGRPLSTKIVIAAGVALLGIGIMSWEGGGLTVGDWLTFASAIGIALYILRLEAVTQAHATLPLVAVQLLTMALLGMLWASPHWLHEVQAMAYHVPAIAYLGLVVTAVPICTQAIAQRWVPADEAAMLYTLEPVFATVFSVWFLAEELGWQGVIGAGLVLTATAWSQGFITLRAFKK